MAMTSTWNVDGHTAARCDTLGEMANVTVDHHEQLREAARRIRDRAAQPVRFEAEIEEEGQEL